LHFYSSFSKSETIFSVAEKKETKGGQQITLDTNVDLSNSLKELQKQFADFNQLPENTPEEIINHLKDEGSRWVKDQDPDDDVTFVVIKVK